LIDDACAQGQLEFAVVPDLLDQSAISKALNGITLVIHLASPLAVEVSDAITNNILNPTDLHHHKDRRLRGCNHSTGHFNGDNNA
jgi:hypothetical protein